MPAPRKATEAARRHFAEHFGDDEYVIARTASDRHPKDQRPIHLSWPSGRARPTTTRPATTAARLGHTHRTSLKRLDAFSAC